MILSDLSQGQVLLSEINFCGFWVFTTPHKIYSEIKQKNLWILAAILRFGVFSHESSNKKQPFPNKPVSESLFFPVVFFKHVISTNDQPTL